MQHVVIRVEGHVMSSPAGPLPGMMTDRGTSLFRRIFSLERHYVSKMDQKFHFFPPCLAKRVIWVICKFSNDWGSKPCHPADLDFLSVVVPYPDSPELGACSNKKEQKHIVCISARSLACQGRSAGCFLLQPAASTWRDSWGLSLQQGASGAGDRALSVPLVPFPLVRKWHCIPPGEASSAW